MALLITADGNVSMVKPKRGREFSGQEVHELIGGYFEVVKLRRGRLMLVDEDGLRKELPINVNATVLAQQEGGLLDRIVGTVLVVEPGEIS